LNNNLASSSSKVQWRLRSTDTSVVDASSMSRAENSAVEARWWWGWWRNITSVAFISWTGGISDTTSVDQGGVGVLVNRRGWAPGALNVQRIRDTGGTGNARGTQVSLASWGRWRRDASVEFWTAALTNGFTVSIHQGCVRWLSTNITWAPGTLKSQSIIDTTSTSVGSIVRCGDHVSANWLVDRDGNWWRNWWGHGWRDGNWWRRWWRNWWRNWWDRRRRRR
jgi:hypothetical protein